MPVSPQITITPEDITFKSFDITAVSYTSSTATYTATGHTLSAGNIVTITGLAPDGYNGTYTISSIATNTFTIANATNTALTDQAGNVYWADPTEYEYSGGQTVTYRPNDGDVSSIVSSALAPIETAVNGKNKIYRQSTAPSGSLVTGDVWFDTSNGNRQYYWNGTAWVDVQDTAIAAAASAATAAQSTADGKNKVYRQGSTPSGTFAIGDLWFDTANDNKISRWDGSSWVANTLGNNALASISANKLNAGSIDASVITVSNINAGNISTGYLAAARIQAASLDASVITAGTITASQIATGTITATQIAAGTITATEIAASTITVDKLVAGTLTGYTVQTSSGSNAVVLDGPNNALGIKYGGTYAGWLVGIGSGAFMMHYGSSPSTTAYPRSSVSSTTASMAADGSNSLSITTSGNNMQGAMTFGAAVTMSNNLTVNSYIYNPGYQVSTSGGAARINDASTPTARLVAASGSSIRFKKDIVDVNTVEELNPRLLLTVPVKAFRYRDDYLDVEDERSGVLVPGFIAEELDAIYPVAVDHDSQGRASRWSSDFIVPGLLTLIQDQEIRIKALEGK